MKISHFVLCGVILFSGLTVSLFCGCEGDPDTENVSSEFDRNPYSGGDRSGTTDSRMKISPTSATLTNNGAVASFTVQGASGAASWSVQDISRGSILSQSATGATYERSSSGDNVVIATDSKGNAVFATVSQP